MTAEQLFILSPVPGLPSPVQTFECSGDSLLQSCISPHFQPFILPFFQSSSLQPETFVPQRIAFVPQTTNREISPITSNYARKQAFTATQNNRKIFVPGKKILKFFLLKNPASVSRPPSSVALHAIARARHPIVHRLSCTLYPASSILNCSPLGSTSYPSKLPFANHLCFRINNQQSEIKNH
jgi:hypothetical protein